MMVTKVLILEIRISDGASSGIWMLFLITRAYKYVTHVGPTQFPSARADRESIDSDKITTGKAEQ